MIHKCDGTGTVSNCSRTKGVNVFIKIFILFIYLVVYKFEDLGTFTFKNKKQGLER